MLRRQVETIGDAYMVVSGAPEKEGNHAERVCDMALDMVDAITDLKDPSTGIYLYNPNRCGMQTIIQFRSTFADTCWRSFGGRGCGYCGVENAPILFVRRQCEHGVTYGVHQRRNDDPHLAIHEGTAAECL